MVGLLKLNEAIRNYAWESSEKLCGASNILISLIKPEMWETCSYRVNYKTETMSQVATIRSCYNVTYGID